MDLSRIAVVGTSCSGKTTFARGLSEILDAPHVELDALYWEANWQARPAAEFRRLVEESLSCERWIADGNYGTVRPLIWSRATAIVWMNYPFRLIFSRALSRTLRRGLMREELYSGNRESLRRAFLSRDSILLWVITSHRRRKREYRSLKESDRYPLRFFELRSPSQAARFLSQVQVGAVRGRLDG